MSLKYVVLGFLSDSPRSGYDLKKAFASSDLVYWSGNNNQVYTALLELDKEGLVTHEVQVQADNPPRKEYSITKAGQAALAKWVATPPQMPQVRSPFLVQLMWGAELPPAELRDLLDRYETELRGHVEILHERARRENSGEADTREHLLRRAISERWEAIFQGEMEWAHNLRRELDAQEQEPPQ